MKSFRLILDPRTKIWILLGSNLLIFFNPNPRITVVYTLFLSLLYLLSKHGKALLGFALIGGFFLVSDRYILPSAPDIWKALFSISIKYTLKMFPNMMAAAFLILTTSLHDAVLAMRKFHFPQQLITSISVTLRYFPALREEMSHISDAIKMRSLPLSARIEAFVVPMMVAATNTAEELSAAAVTRGVENPARKTSIQELKLRTVDLVLILLQSAFPVWAICS